MVPETQQKGEDLFNRFYKIAEILTGKTEQAYGTAIKAQETSNRNSRDIYEIKRTAEELLAKYNAMLSSVGDVKGISSEIDSIRKLTSSIIDSNSKNVIEIDGMKRGLGEVSAKTESAIKATTGLERRYDKDINSVLDSLKNLTSQEDVKKIISSDLMDIVTKLQEKNDKIIDDKFKSVKGEFDRGLEKIGSISRDYTGEIKAAKALLFGDREELQRAIKGIEFIQEVINEVPELKKVIAERAKNKLKELEKERKKKGKERL